MLSGDVPIPEMNLYDEIKRIGWSGSSRERFIRNRVLNCPSRILRISPKRVNRWQRGSIVAILYVYSWIEITGRWHGEEKGNVLFFLIQIVFDT